MYSHKNKNAFYTFFMILLIYNFIFPIRLVIFPQFAYLLYLLLLFQVIFYKDWFKIFSRTHFFAPTLFMGVIILLLSISSILYNQSNDFLGIVLIVKYIFAITSSLIITLFIMSQYQINSLLVFIKIMVLSILLVAVVCILEFFIPEAKMLLGDIIYDPPGHTDYATSFRVKGLASSGGASLSVGLATGVILSNFLITITNGKKTIFWIFSTFIISFSTLFVGRTGILLILAFFLLQFISHFSLKSIVKVVIISLSLFYLSEIFNDDQINIIYSFSLEPIKNYIEYGAVSSRSTDALATMFYLPDIEHLFFGAGFWRYPTHGYLLSDSGYMKILMAFGIFGFIVFYSYQLFISYSAYTYYKRFKNYKLNFAFLFSFLFLAEIKEEFFMQNYSFKLIILLITYSFVDKVITAEKNNKYT